MTFKNPIAVLLLVFAVGSVAYLFLAGPGTESATGAVAPEAGASQVIVYYMDMGKDCSTCLNLESYTREALETFFAPELASGAIGWRTADLDDPANEHFVSDFNLYTKSVVLVRMEDGVPVRFDSLSRIWELVYDKAAYLEYIRKEVRGFLDSSGAAE